MSDKKWLINLTKDITERGDSRTLTKLTQYKENW